MKATSYATELETSWFSRGAYNLYLLTRVLTVSAAALMVIVIFLQVIARYVFNQSLTWSEELARYLFVWVCLLGASIGIYKKAHPGIEAVVNRLPTDLQRFVIRARGGFEGAFFIVLFFYGEQAMEHQWEALSAALQIRMAWPTLAIPTAAFLIFLFTLEQVMETYKRPLIGALITIVLAGALAEFSNFLVIENGVALIFILLILFMVLGTPIAIALGMASFWAITTTGAASLDIIPQQMFGGLDSFALLAVPFFLLAGTIMEKGGVATRIVNFVASVVSRVRGGLGMANIGASVIFADISGSAVADTAAIGSIMIPGMVKRGYSKSYVTALQAAAGSLGMLFPPSISMIIFAMVAQISVAQLFMASFVPGLLVAGSFAVVNYVVARKRGYPVEPWTGFAEVGRSFKVAFLSLMAPVIILGGILSGVFTATEAGVIAVAYVLVVSVFAHKDLKIRELVPILEHSSVLTARVTFVLMNAMVFGWFLTVNHVPQNISMFLTSVTRNPIITLLLINVFLLIIHTFLETGSTILIVVPILLPLLESLGISPVLFGITIMLNSAIGLILPPIGIGLYTATALTKVPLEKATREILPFVSMIIIVLVMVILFPNLALGLTKLLH